MAPCPASAPNPSLLPKSRAASPTLYGEPVWRPHGDPMSELVLTILSQNTSDTNSGRAFMRLQSALSRRGRTCSRPTPKRSSPRSRPAASPASRPRASRPSSRRSTTRLGSFDLMFLKDLPMDEAKAWLRSLPGVGPKTAACVLMFALGRPALPVDTHVHRVAQRLGLVPAKAGARRSPRHPRSDPRAGRRLSLPHLPHQARPPPLPRPAPALRALPAARRLPGGPTFIPRQPHLTA